MTEKEKMEHHKLYDANYDKELEKERLHCKRLCQIYNQLPVDHLEERHEFIKKIIGKTGENIHIEPDFWCDYGYRISVGENFYANHGLVILDAGCNHRKQCGHRQWQYRDEGYSIKQCRCRQSVQSNPPNHRG